MRTETDMFDLILDTARGDARIRAVVMNGSRANPNARRDIFRDYDIIYFVTEVASFKADPGWIACFGEMMILQLPDDMSGPPPESQHSYAYLMQFADGNRIDLTLFPVDRIAELAEDSLTIPLLDKDGILPAFPPASESSYLPQPPGPKAFADCCNEFWWVSAYVAKGLWRDEIPYAHYMLGIVRDELLKMLAWQIGVDTAFRINPGKYGKYYRRHLPAEQWALLLKTYAAGEEDSAWAALFAMCELFRACALRVAGHFGYDYPHADDRRVSAHLRYVQSLPRDAQEMYP